MSNSVEPLPAASLAVGVAVPNFEVKVFLDAAKVLTVEFKPTKDADGAFHLKHPSHKITMQFLDAHPCQLHPEGWDVRLRRFEGIGEVELSYKRRYRISPESLPEAQAAAARDGFTAGEKNYAAQVEWGYERQRLSFTRKKMFKAAGLGEMELPPLADARATVVRELPGKLDRLRQPGWARGLLTDAHLYGPVFGKRYVGQWQGPDLDFEVWLIRTESGQGVEPVVELSFKADRQEGAAGFRDKLVHLVRNHGWLLDRDVLKTEMILTRY